MFDTTKLTMVGTGSPFSKSFTTIVRWSPKEAAE